MIALLKSILVAATAYIQLRTKSFYYDLVTDSRKRQQQLINEIEELRSSPSDVNTDHADLLRNRLISEKEHLEHLSAFYSDIEQRYKDSN